MATMAVDPTFVDTNVPVNASLNIAPFHLAASRALKELRAAGVALRISRQILREYLATLSRPQSFTSPLPVIVLAADIVYSSRNSRSPRTARP